jgi:hypothetical protein
MRSKRFLFGSSDSGALNYFRHLFVDSEDVVHQFHSVEELQLLLDGMGSSEYPIVLTGSAIGSITLDKLAILECQHRLVNCFSIIEHWSWYLERFLADGVIVYPKKIFVNDLLAQEEAVHSGLPGELIVPLGNPVLESMAMLSAKRKPKNPNQIISLRKKYHLPVEKKLIFFVSENLNADFRCGGQDLLGFDEFEVFRDIVDTFSAKEFHVVVKEHPAEKKDKYESFSNSVGYIEKISTADLADVADTIIGMGSMMLLELSLFRDDIISFRPNAKIDFIGNTLEVVVKVLKKEDLISAVYKTATNSSAFRESFIGSRARIIEYLKGEP